MIQYRAKVNEPFGAPIKVGDLVEIDPSEWLDHSTSMLYFHDKGQKMWAGTKSTWDKYFEPVSELDRVIPQDDVRVVPQDNVNNPSHYGQGKIEAIEYIKDSLTKEEYIGYLRGNIAKYLHRWRYKNGLEDLNKAQVYLGWLIKEIE
jgi:hypothetical protein